MKQLKRFLLPILLFIIGLSHLYAGTTGKIAGRITDKSTGEPLVGANIVVEGTQLGSTTDFEGRYSIIHVPPGIHRLHVSYIGYRKTIVSDIRVFIDQTSEINVVLEPEAFEVGELVVVAERQVIKPDVATSVVAVSNEEIETLPVANVDDVINLQAGIRGGNIRGGSGEKALYLMDGVTLRDPRNNEPSTKVALSAIEEISVERGGFNAEYGQVRSGIINIVTREGKRDKYSGSFQIRSSPPSRKYHLVDGNYDIQDPNSYLLRPFFDDDVCWEGTTSGAWDEYTRAQYPEFSGWNSISDVLCSDDDPDNDLTPLGAQRVFMYEVRKNLAKDMWDYDIDAGFGGPVPLIGKYLGDLRFYSSYRKTRDVLVWPLTRPDYQDYDWTTQVTSNIADGIKLRVSGLYGKRFTIRNNWDSPSIGSYYYPRSASEVADVASYASGSTDLITMFSDFNFALSDISHRSLSAKLTHTLSSETFYEVSVENFWTDYETRPTAYRDTSVKYEIVPGYYEDSNPFGYWPYEAYGVVITNGDGTAKARDFTTTSATTFKADITSQVNFQNLIKAGVEFNYNDLDFDYGTIQSGTGGEEYGTRVQMRVFPVKAAFYIQDKLETDEFILNVGLRLDYSNANSDWYDIEDFDEDFVFLDEDTEFTLTNPEAQWQLSPRLGIAHPITEYAKLFFNYGHFKQMPNYEALFRIQRTPDNELKSYGNPNLTLAKTVSYELGFDFSLNDEILLQIAAYYKDIKDQADYVTYISTASDIEYTYTTSNGYEDIRGFELTLRKMTGKWWSGFANYTYQVTSNGYFGRTEINKDTNEQTKADREEQNFYQDKPYPQPFARASLNFFTPVDFGPRYLGHHVFGNFMLNFLLDWQAGGKETYNPNDALGVLYNVERVDYFNADLRFSKRIDVGIFNIDLFMDVTNVFNAKRLWDYDDTDYLASLHLPESDAYDNIPGDDKIGEYREPGAEYQPMEYQYTIDQTKSGKERPIYYEGSTGSYYRYSDGEWTKADQSEVDQVLEDKAYIDMPNASTFWFLNPRNFYFGIKLSFNI